MKAIVKNRPEKGLECVEVARPKPQADEILIDVKAAAICGTDIHYYHWNKAAESFATKFGVKFPFTVGHEVCGVVCEVGDNVKNVKVGDKVALETHIPCGKCYQCQNGQAHNCTNMGIYGTSCDGCFADYAIAPANVAFVLPEGVSYEEGSLFEPGGVAMRAVEESCLLPGDTVTVFGCGPIGMIALQILKACGAGKIIAVDIDDYRLEMAKKYADVVINSVKEDVVKIVQEETKPRGGSDVILEMTGATQIYDILFDCLRLEGHIVTVGHPGGNVSINIQRNINLKGAQIKGLFGRRIWDTWWKLQSLVENGRINLLDVVTHRYAFDQCDEAFEQTGKGAGKILFVK